MTTKDEITKPFTYYMFSTDLMRQSQAMTRVLRILKEAPECEEDREKIAQLTEQMKPIGKLLCDAGTIMSEIGQEMVFILAERGLYSSDPALMEELVDAARRTTGWPWLYFGEKK